MRIFRSFLFVLAFLCLASYLAPYMAAAAAANSHYAMNGKWRIDGDRTLAENDLARQAYEARGPEERAAMFAGWGRRTLIIDFPAKTITEEIKGARKQVLAITSVESAPGGVRVHFENAESVLLTLDTADVLRFTMDPTSPMILVRIK